MGIRQGVWVLAATAASALSACSTPETLGGLGSSCLMFQDCQPAYVCVANVCTNNLDALVNTEPLPPSDAAADAPATTATTYEASVPDGSYAPPSEAGPPAETGTPVRDATLPPAEAAPTPGPDSSPGPDSTAAPGPDSSSVEAAAQPPEAAASGGE